MLSFVNGLRKILCTMWGDNVRSPYFNAMVCNTTKKMSLRAQLIFLVCGLMGGIASAQVSIVVDVNLENRPISPYIYGMNNATDHMERAQEAGIRFSRQNHGNNATKYNWRKKLSSHPDWYNNVYASDWDSEASTLQAGSSIQGMFAFQLIGRVASTTEANFPDWDYNGSNWWEGVNKNYCGNGSSAGNYKFTDGDYHLYTEEWPADSSVEILTHWEKDLKLDLNQFLYWNMDNEVEIWAQTHDDIIPEMNDEVYEMYMQNYFATVKAARKINPNIKICGPVAASEWTWYSIVGGSLPTYKGKTYCWLEYFIMRCAEEEKKSGIKMLDVIDIHNYPYDVEAADILQTHRMYWDTTFLYPFVNGVKVVNVVNGNGWDESIEKEMVFVRCQDWVEKYFGKDYQVSYGVSEYNVNSVSEQNTMVTALAYASTLGEGSRHGMEYFTPWGWKTGMWETVHLFSRYAQTTNVSSVSSDENLLSVYASKNEQSDSLTLIIVNRDPKDSGKLSIQIKNYNVLDGTYDVVQLSGLPETETFVSHTNNALKHSFVELQDSRIETSVPGYSITAIIIPSKVPSSITTITNKGAIYPNPTKDYCKFSGFGKIEIINVYSTSGVLCKSISCFSEQEVNLNLSDLEKGMYSAVVQTSNGLQTVSFIVE